SAVDPSTRRPLGAGPFSPYRFLPLPKVIVFLLMSPTANTKSSTPLPKVIVFWLMLPSVACTSSRVPLPKVIVFLLMSPPVAITTKSAASSKINLSLVTLGAIKDWLMNVAIVAPPFLSMSRRSRKPAPSLRQTDQAVHALACTHRDSWICCYEPDKKD